MKNKHIMRFDYSEKYGKQLFLSETVLYDDRDYSEEEIKKAVEADTVNELHGVIKCYTADFEKCFRSLINKEDN